MDSGTILDFITTKYFFLILNWLIMMIILATIDLNSPIYIVSKNRTKIDNVKEYFVWFGALMKSILLNLFIAVMVTWISNDTYIIFSDIFTFRSIPFFGILILSDIACCRLNYLYFKYAEEK